MPATHEPATPPPDPYARRRQWLLTNTDNLTAAGLLPLIEPIESDVHDDIRPGDHLEVVFSPSTQLPTRTPLHVDTCLPATHLFPGGFLLATDHHGHRYTVLPDIDIIQHVGPDTTHPPSTPPPAPSGDPWPTGSALNP